MPARLSGLARVKQTALESATPLSAHLELTHACPLRCVFCCNPPLDGRRPLDFSGWLEVLEDLREIGTLTVGFTGGEPLAHPDFFAIARAARRLRFAVRILTNGMLVGDREAEQIARLKPLVVELSLHGASAAVHDETTGKQGSFAALWRAVERLRERGVRLLLKTPVTRLNAHEIDAMLASTEAAGIPLRLDPTLIPRDDGDHGPLRFAAGDDDLRRVFERFADRGLLPVEERQPGGLNCGVGRLTVAVDPFGDVFPCPQWRSRALGNVRRQRLRDIWRGSIERRDSAEVARHANDRLLQLGSAPARHPYCPAIAERHTGDPLQPDPVFLAQAEAAARLRREDR